MLQAMDGRGMKHILLVDDDAGYRGSLRDLLEEEGYRCDEAGDGQSALEKLAGSSFHLVITDFRMPRVNGLGLLAAMAKGNRLAATPVIVITGELDERIRNHALASGASCVLFKPSHPANLLSLMARTMNESDRTTRNHGSG